MPHPARRRPAPRRSRPGRANPRHLQIHRAFLTGRTAADPWAGGIPAEVALDVRIPPGSLVVWATLPGIVPQGQMLGNERQSVDRHGRVRTRYHEGIVVTSGWNGSFHEAMFDPLVYCWSKGRRPFRHCRNALLTVLAALDLDQAEDVVSAIRSSRASVRFGD